MTCRVRRGLRLALALAFTGCAHERNYMEELYAREAAARERDERIAQALAERSRTAEPDSAPGGVSAIDAAAAPRAHEDWVQPVVIGLARRPGASARLLALLDDLLLTTSAKVSHLGPNARAFLSNGRPAVEIDLEFIARLSAASDVAGLALTRRGEVAQILQAAGRAYGDRIAAAIVNGQPLPLFHFDREALSANPALVAMIVPLAIEALMAGITWAILHEVGHHMNGHLQREPVDHEESRAWELSADAWAFSEMKRMGFGLAPLEAILGALAAEQEILRYAGQVPAEQHSTHPSFATRLDRLSAFHPEEPPRSSWLMIMHVAGDNASNLRAHTIMVPKNPRSGVILAMYDQPGGVVRMPYEYMPNGELHIYGRIGDELSEIVVEDPRALYPSLRFHFRHVGAPASTDISKGMHLDVKYWDEVEVGPIKLWQVVAMDPIEALVAHVAQIDRRPEVLQRARAIQTALLSTLKAILIVYAKGELTIAEATQQVSAESHRAADEFKALVGAENYASIQAQMFSDPIVTWAMDSLLPRSAAAQR